MQLGRSGERSLRPDIAMVSLGLKLTGMANDEIYVVYFLVVFVSALVRGRDTDMTDYNAIGVKPTHTNACLYNDAPSMRAHRRTGSGSSPAERVVVADRTSPARGAAPIARTCNARRIERHRGESARRSFSIAGWQTSAGFDSPASAG